MKRLLPSVGKTLVSRATILTHDQSINGVISAGVTFPLVKKSDVNGPNTNEVYKWLKNKKAWLFGLTMIKVRPGFCSWPEVMTH